MYLTKAEMEDIWRNKPVDYLKSFKKKMKGRKKYSVVVQPYTTQYHEKQAIEVIATCKSVAEWNAKDLCRKQNTGKEITGVCIYSVTEVK